MNSCRCLLYHLGLGQDSSISSIASGGRSDELVSLLNSLSIVNLLPTVLSKASKGTFCFPGSSVGKESAFNAGDTGSIPGSGRSPGEGNGNPLQYSSLQNSKDSGA